MRKFAQLSTNLRPLGDIVSLTYKNPNTGEVELQRATDLYKQNVNGDALYYDLKNKRYEDVIDDNLSKINYTKAVGPGYPRKVFKANTLIPAVINNHLAADGNTEDTMKKAAGLTLLARFATDHNYTINSGMLNELLGNWEDPRVKKAFSDVFGNITFPSHNDIPTTETFDFAKSLKETTSPLGKQMDMFSMSNNLDNVLFTKDIYKTTYELPPKQQKIDFNRYKYIFLNQPQPGDFIIYSKDNYMSHDFKDLAHTGPEDWVIVVSKNKNNVPMFRAKFNDLIQVINPRMKYNDLINTGVKKVGTLSPNRMYVGDLNQEIVK